MVTLQRTGGRDRGSTLVTAALSRDVRVVMSSGERRKDVSSGAWRQGMLVGADSGNGRAKLAREIWLLSESLSNWLSASSACVFN